MSFSLYTDRPFVVTGGTGYLGQWIIDTLLDGGYTVALLYHAADGAPPPAWPGPAERADRVLAYPVDLATGAGLDAAFAALDGPPAGVINAAAISSPAACEADPATAMAVNVPTHLLAALQKSYLSAGGNAGAPLPPPPPFIHISTDQVYPGTGTPKSGWKESARLDPLNTYARSKAAAEAAVAAAWPVNHVILRCSVMVGGPEPPAWALPAGRRSFLHFAIAEVVRCGATGRPSQATFYDDEIRSFVGVRDVAVIAVFAMTLRWAWAAKVARDGQVDAGPPRVPPILNVGGPARLSRAGFAREVAKEIDLSPECVTSAPRPPQGGSCGGSSGGGVATPANIGMDLSALREAMDPQFILRGVGDIMAAEFPGHCHRRRR